MTRFLLAYLALATPAFLLIWACCRAGAMADAAMGLGTCLDCGETTETHICPRCLEARR